MHIDVANLSNLIGLWQKYGASASDIAGPVSLTINRGWPHRCWFEMRALDQSNKSLEQFVEAGWVANIPDSSVVPVWKINNGRDCNRLSAADHQYIEEQLMANGYSCTFEQTAMYLSLQEGRNCSVTARKGFQVSPVLTPEDIKQWVEVGSEAFNYSIDAQVIANVVADKDLQILLAWQDKQAVAAALLYKTGEVIGVHQVGVKQAFQGQGIAFCMMQHIVSACASWQGKAVVLQASKVGRPLYEKLGFNPQFNIKNYQKLE